MKCMAGDGIGSCSRQQQKKKAFSAESPLTSGVASSGSLFLPCKYDLS